MQIQPYTDNYKQEVAEFILGIQHKEFGIPITLHMQPDLMAIPAFYQVKNGNFWIAKNDERIIGTISLLDIGNGQGALRKMFVDRDYRGKQFGVGQMLLNTLLDWAKRSGIWEIFLGTTKLFTAAQRFYEKNRFEEIARQALPDKFPVMEVDIKFYKILIDP